MRYRQKFILAAALFALGFLAIPFINYMRNTMEDFNYPPANISIRHITVVIFTLLFIAYWFFIKTQDEYPQRTISQTYFRSAFLLGIFLCAIYPIFSIDLYEYIIRGRIMSIYNANPYTTAPSAYPNDIYYNVIFWKYQPMIYGPVWAYIVGLITAITGENIFFTQFTVKLSIFFFHLMTALLLYRIAKDLRLERPTTVFEAYLLNPYILIMALVDGHMDTIMIFFLMASILALFDRKFRIAFLFLALSFLTKYLTLILIPFYLIYMFYATADRRRFVKEVFSCMAVMAGAVMLFYAPLWEGASIFAGLQVVRTGFDTNTFPYLLYKLVSAVAPGISRDLMRYISYGMFTVLYLFSFVYFLKVKEKRQGLLNTILILFSGYIILSSFQLGAWYMVWIIPFILLSRLPYKYLLAGLISFASLILFWKRVSFLIIIALSIYVIALVTRRLRCIKS